MSSNLLFHGSPSFDHYTSYNPWANTSRMCKGPPQITRKNNIKNLTNPAIIDSPELRETYPKLVMAK